MKNNKLNSKITLALALMSAVAFTACKDDLQNNGLVSKTLDASFTVTNVTSSPNKFLLSSSNDNYLFSEWDFNDDAGYNKGTNNLELFIPDAGTYNIKHRVVGIGGVYSDVITKTITVATSDPAAGNLVKGGKFATADDNSQWTVSPSGGVCTFADGWATFTNVAGSWGQAAIQQPIQVEAGKKYKIDMLFKTEGVKNGWFKVYACTTPPTLGVEYTGEILVAEVAIWGDNVGAKSGKFSSILNPDSGTKTKNVVTFTTSGTIYLSIQCGAEDLKGGVSVSKVEFRGVSE
ncbi:MAG: hypothetical protein H6Q20_2330 [Bacteroidetes bacterium]|nr:hypothetical protein [Bacteroidota bacterium]